MNPLRLLLRKPRRKDWIRKHYTPYALNQKLNIFMSIARYSRINRPIKGDYFEFGSHGANTIRMAWDCFHHLFDWNYVAFDSFEGLPEIGEIDKMKIWEKGKLKTSDETFKKIAYEHGIPKDRLELVKGYYCDTLTDELKRNYAGRKAAVAYIDCDLYSSTVDVLNFLEDFLQVGTIVVFDDWNCFFGDPNKGERLAFREFCERRPDILFEPFVQNGEQMSFICLGTEAQRKEVEATHKQS